MHNAIKTYPTAQKTVVSFLNNLTLPSAALVSTHNSWLASEGGVELLSEEYEGGNPGGGIWKFGGGMFGGGIMGPR